MRFPGRHRHWHGRNLLHPVVANAGPLAQPGIFASRVTRRPARVLPRLAEPGSPDFRASARLRDRRDPHQPPARLHRNPWDQFFRGASRDSILHRWWDSACNGSVSPCYHRRSSYCSQCIRGYHRADLVQFFSAGRDRQSKACGADKIDNAAIDLRNHGVRRGETTDGYHRLGGN